MTALVLTTQCAVDQLLTSSPPKFSVVGVRFGVFICSEAKTLEFHFLVTLRCPTAEWWGPFYGSCGQSPTCTSHRPPIVLPQADASLVEHGRLLI
jgi:hypothetical protein